MSRRYKTEEVIVKLREVEVLMANGVGRSEAVRRIGVSLATYSRWKKEFGGMKVDQARRLKDLERENLQLRKLVADLSLDKAMLEEVNKGNF